MPQKTQITKRPEPGAITKLLSELPTQPSAGVDLMAIIYRDLRRIAAAEFRRERRSQTRQATDLVHESYARLMKNRKKRWASRGEFFKAAACSTRRVLVDWARIRDAKKRYGKLKRVKLTEVEKVTREDPTNLLVVHDLLKKLAKVSPRQSQIVEMRFFTGLDIAETAEALGIGLTTVKLEWLRAKRWLRQELA